MLTNFDANNPPENFCSVPWLQIHTEPGGEVQPCCYFLKHHELGNWNETPIKEIFHGERWNALRKQMLENEQPQGCAKCYQEEKIGLSSTRKRFNDMYQRSFGNNHNKFIDIIKHSNGDGTVNSSLKLSTVDLIFNNLCNYKCRSCSPDFSTSWYSDAVEEAKIDNKMPPAFSILLDNGKIKNLKDDLAGLIELIDNNSEVHFTGGEPMMQAEQYTFLKMLIDAGKTNVRIRYNTNLSLHKLNNIDAFDLLKHFSNVIIVGSIDAIGKQGAYIRHGFDWDTAIAWFDEAIEKLPNAVFGVSLVYGILNCLSATEVHKFLLSNPKYSNFGFYINILHGPDWLNVKCLPEPVRNEAILKVQSHIDYLNTLPQFKTIKTSKEHWNDVLTFLKSSSGSNTLQEFFKQTKILDQLRNENFEETFPELYAKIKNYDN
jgi:radical SAM protein with 4Fe4S-binding SPASM domain